jgi:DNA invertase Pin-like site-specific DNA recombinase
MKYGYLRVSTDKQNYDRQLFVLQEYNLDRIFEETISGTKKACGREEFDKLLSVITKGDEVYFESMSRMARSMQDLIDTTNFIVKKKKARVIFIKENLSIGGEGLDAMGALVFNIMGAFAQFERDLISDRTRQAMAAIKEKGEVQLGAPRQYDDAVVSKVHALRDRGLSMQKIADELEISKSTVARLLKVGG